MSDLSIDEVLLELPKLYKLYELESPELAELAELIMLVFICIVFKLASFLIRNQHIIARWPNMNKLNE